MAPKKAKGKKKDNDDGKTDGDRDVDRDQQLKDEQPTKHNPGSLISYLDLNFIFNLINRLDKLCKELAETKEKVISL